MTSIIRTVDRDLAILIGRALDHQKYFHDVNYEHRLRDSDKELYQFKDMCNIPTPTKRKLRDGKKELKQDQKMTGLPNGVFTILTQESIPYCGPCLYFRKSAKANILKKRDHIHMFLKHSNTGCSETFSGVTLVRTYTTSFDCIFDS